MDYLQMRHDMADAFVVIYNRGCNAALRYIGEINMASEEVLERLAIDAGFDLTRWLIQ